VRKSMGMVFAVGLLLTACGGGGGGGGGGSSSAACSDLSSGPSFSIEMKDFKFSPSCVVAKNTQKLDLTNGDSSTTHTFTIPNTPIDVELSGGKSQELAAPGDALAPGTYVFYCRFHGHPDGTGMAGKITVT
jgi:plastocyanin